MGQKRPQGKIILATRLDHCNSNHVLDEAGGSNGTSSRKAKNRSKNQQPKLPRFFNHVSQLKLSLQINHINP